MIIILLLLFHSSKSGLSLKSRFDGCQCLCLDGQSSSIAGGSQRILVIQLDRFLDLHWYLQDGRLFVQL